MNRQLEEGYGRRYPIKQFCDECGLYGARFTGTWNYIKSRWDYQPSKEQRERTRYTEGKCGVCGFEGRVAYPDVYGYPTMTNYLWGPDFVRIIP